MRHRIHHLKLNRTSAHRRALLRNMAQSLIEHGQITTTVAKAKNLRPYVERLMTLAIKTRKLSAGSDAAGSLRSRRRIYTLLGDRCMIADEHRDAYAAMSDARRGKTKRMSSGRRYRRGEPQGRLAFTAESVIHRLIETVAPRYEDRPGGYTRLIRLPDRRLGDAGRLAVLQFVGEEEAPVSLTKPGRSARRRRADGRYAMAVKAAKDRGRRAPTRERGKASPTDAGSSGADAEDQPSADGAGEDNADAEA